MVSSPTRSKNIGRTLLFEAYIGQECYTFSPCRNNKLFVGNIGDSRCIACCSGLAEALSIDHKPGDALERDRIENVSKMYFI